MGNDNKSARELLEMVYGRHCFICQGIRRLNPPKPKKIRYKNESIAKQLTYHHIVPRQAGGQTTVENGAELCKSCHDWLEQLSKKTRKKVNAQIQQYKVNFFIRVAEISTEGIQQAREIELQETDEVIIIPAYDFTDREYQEFLQRRRQRELEKPKWKGEER